MGSDLHFRFELATTQDWTELASIQVLRPLICEDVFQQLLHTNEHASFTTDPIDTGTGNYRYVPTDIAIPGRGPAPSFTRAYNSFDNRSTSLGPGWTHNFAIRVRCTGDETGDLFFVRPNGQTDRYTANPGGSYSPPPGVQATLVANEFPSYTLTTVDQTVQQFDSAGNLTSITDRFGNETVLTYNDDGQLVSISDPAGRGVLTLAYDAVTGLLTSVTDWIDRIVEYGYDTLGRLETVTDREGKVTTYAYDGTTHRLTTITDANGDVQVTMTYDAEGRVATQQDAMGLITGEMTTLAYVTNPDDTQTTTVAYPATSLEPTYHSLQVDTYNTDGWVTQHVMKPTSNSADDVVNQYTYDANGFRDSVVDGRGNLWKFCYDVDYAGMPIAGSRGNLTRLATPPSGASGSLVTLYQYDAKSNLVQVVPSKGIVPPAGTLTAQLATSISKLGSIGLGGAVTAPPPPTSTLLRAELHDRPGLRHRPGVRRRHAEQARLGHAPLYGSGAGGADGDHEARVWGLGQSRVGDEDHPSAREHGAHARLQLRRDVRLL